MKFVSVILLSVVTLTVGFHLDTQCAIEHIPYTLIDPEANPNHFLVYRCCVDCQCPEPGPPVRRRGLRRLTDKKEQENNVFSPTFPHDFAVYDTNNDNKINLEEFAAATNLKIGSKGLREAFVTADANNNGEISCKEFQEAPLAYDGPPVCGNTLENTTPAPEDNDFDF